MTGLRTATPGAIDTSGTSGAPIDTFDWRAVEDALNDAGNALLPGLLTPGPATRWPPSTRATASTARAW